MRVPMNASEATVYVLMLVSWVMGLVAAQGFWSTTLALLFPPWAWYLLAEWAMGAQCG